MKVHPSPSVHPVVPVLALTVLILMSCAPERPSALRPGGEPDVFTDPQLFRLDTVNHTGFDGRGGTLLPGEGWFPPEEGGGSGPWQAFAWSGQEAELFFLRPRSGHPGEEPLDLLLHCHPAPSQGDVPQQVAVVMDGETVATAALGRGWKQVRVPLAEPRGGGGLRRILLRFAYSARPSDVRGTADERKLSAACTDLAVVPRWVEDPLGLVDSTGLDRNGDHLRLPPRTAVSLPLPPHSRGRLVLGEASGCESCVLDLAVVGPGGDATRLYRGAAAGAVGSEVSFTTGGPGLSRLRFHHVPEKATGSDSSIKLRLPAGFLRADPASDAPPDRPHVFVYLVDTLRADALEPYGAPEERSPHLRRFADGAVTYLDARAASSWTLPSVTSLLTGAFPFRHGIMQGKKKMTAEGFPTLASRLSAAGWDTVGISQSFVASGAFGLDVGFDRFFLNNHLNSRALRTGRIRTYLLEWLYSRGEQGTPIFAYLHTVGPHAPYAPVEQYRRFAREAPGSLPPQEYGPTAFMLAGHGEDPDELAHLRALYAGEVLYEDHHLGRFVELLRYLDLLDDSFVIFVSDHGEEFYEHGGFDHGRTLYEEQLRVPLLVRYPGGEHAGTRVQHSVNLTDVVPTLVRRLDLPAGSPAADGSSLAPEDLEGRPVKGALIWSEVNPAASEHLASVDLRTLVRSDLKCIQNLAGVDRFHHPAPPLEVYELSVDPGEQRALAEGSPRYERCRQMMESWESAVLEGAVRVGDGTEETSEGTLDGLRALGYIR